MAGKRFGALDLSATTNTVLMAGASNFDSTVNVRFTNRNAAPVKVRLALVDDIAVNALTRLEPTNPVFPVTKIRIYPSVVYIS